MSAEIVNYAEIHANDILTSRDGIIARLLDRIDETEIVEIRANYWDNPYKYQYLLELLEDFEQGIVEPSMISVPDSPRDLGLPKELWRPHQSEALHSIVNSTKKIVVLVAPTGAGKSLIAAAIPKLLGKSMVALTRYKSLQDQYVRDFDHMANIKGRSNYACVHPKHDGTAADAPCTGSEFFCEYKDFSCPYYGALRGAFRAESAITNYDYGLTTLAYSPVNLLTKKHIIVADEAHYLDDQLTKAAEVEITKKQLMELPPHPRNDEDVEGWSTWAEGSYDIIQEPLNNAEHYVERLKEIIQLGSEEISSRDFGLAKKEANYWRSIATALKRIADLDWASSWVITTQDEKVLMKPLWPTGAQITSSFFSSADKIVLMSATLPPIGELESLFGLPDNSTEVIQVPSNFPLENRMVYVVPIARMNYQTQFTEVEKSMRLVNSLLQQNGSDKALVHTCSYKLRDRAMELLDPSLQADEPLRMGLTIGKLC